MTFDFTRQWGNLLTLSAAYKDPTLSRFIDGTKLQKLFMKTIQFFQIIAHASSALAIDMRILQGLDRELWYNSNTNTTDAEPGPNSSFTSTTSEGFHGLPMTPMAPVPPSMHAPGTPVDGILAPPFLPQQQHHPV